MPDTSTYAAAPTPRIPERPSGSRYRFSGFRPGATAAEAPFERGRRDERGQQHDGHERGVAAFVEERRAAGVERAAQRGEDERHLAARHHANGHGQSLGTLAEHPG